MRLFMFFSVLGLETVCCAGIGGQEEPVIIPNAVSYKFASKISGKEYELFVATPSPMPGSGKLPVLYLLDGNHSFPTAAMTLLRGTESQAISPGIIVGIGYPGDDTAKNLARRTYEFTDSVKLNGGTPTGGLEGFIEVLVKEIKPFIASRYTIDEKHQAIFGKSLGGLAVTRLLLAHTSDFQTYIISSPTLWWNDHSVLRDEASFASRISKDPLSLQVLILSAEKEQVSKDKGGGSPPMVEDAARFAQRLTSYNPAYLKVHYFVFQNETHWSVTEAAVSRAVRFFLEPE